MSPRAQEGIDNDSPPARYDIGACGGAANLPHLHTARTGCPVIVKQGHVPISGPLAPQLLLEILASIQKMEAIFTFLREAIQNFGPMDGRIAHMGNGTHEL
uniref:Phosphogluconate dehydratase n=1 Tax=Ascaris lumbricoides TaxID=6252 RepID=A0A0M3IBA3_ASCLU